MLYKNVAIAAVLILATASSAAVAQTAGKRGVQQRHQDIDATHAIDQRYEPSRMLSPAPKQDMKMIPFPRGGRMEMILVPANPSS
ncbi:hypothetical protein [Methylobacterium bullatum]|jgi:hypothetical protein|uniref:Uncharacterized protein n=1 Tax=Methylobacterium bullatum TaxID=570505 RepID=A0AAV4Z496_9HYPH|nr:hypothetical protein [Methylobacterium bullatum]MBD8903262.1 hypothetical protein [Methylobacterium bullatum]GJD38823.1 hypothetical protein OICFNHDK_1274 [Methylobacterium bullatum]